MDSCFHGGRVSKALKAGYSLHEKPIHSDIELRLVDREVRFLNGGFPVNLDGRINCVDPRYIQATHTLQAVAASDSKVRGLMDLDQKLCDWVSKEFKKVIRGEYPAVEGRTKWR